MAKTATKRSTETLYKRVIELRLQGLTHPAINVKLGIKHAWAAEQRALKAMPDDERKKVLAQLDKLGVHYGTTGAKPKAVKAPKPVKQPKVKTEKPPKAAKPKGAPSRVKNGADKAQLHDAELAAEVDAKREQSPLNMTRAERERAVKDGTLPTADLATLATLPNNGRDFKPVPKTSGARIDKKKGAVAAQ